MLKRSMPGAKRRSTTEPSGSAKCRRTTRGTKGAAAPQFGQDDSILFKEIWRGLRREGWTSKAPSYRSLNNFYRYIQPGRSLEDEEGRDYFVGEQALVTYYMNEHPGNTTIVSNGSTIGISPPVDAPVAQDEADPRCADDLERDSFGRAARDLHAGEISSGPVVCNNAENSDDLAEDTVAPPRADNLERGSFGGDALDLRAGNVSSGPEVCDISEDSDDVVAIDATPSQAAGHGLGGCGQGRHTGEISVSQAGSDTSDSDDVVEVDAVSVGIAARDGGLVSGDRVPQLGGDRARVCDRGRGRGKRRGAKQQGVSAEMVDTSSESDEGSTWDESNHGTRSERVVAGGRGQLIGGGRGGGRVQRQDRGRGRARRDGGGRGQGRSRGDGGGHAQGRGRGDGGGRFRGRGRGKGRGSMQGSRGVSVMKDTSESEDGDSDGEPDYESGRELENRALSTTPSPGSSVAYIDSFVAYAPMKTEWLMTKKLKPHFRQVGATYIIGRVCRRLKKKRTVLYEVRWLDSMFQKHVHCIPLGIVQQGVDNYKVLTRTASKPSWGALTTIPQGEDIPVDAVLEDMVEEQADFVEFDPDQALPASLKEVEAVKSMRFDPRVQMEAPTDLYTHTDGSVGAHVRPQHVHLFTHSASSSFLAYVPVYFWQQVVNESNAYARIKSINLVHPLTLAELMKFLGMLFFMAINDKGEYANYWGTQPEDAILGNQNSSGLENVMPLRRFKLLRKVFCFQAAPPAVERDPAARIRPLLNLLKCTGGKYIDLGRDVALDECSVACRSKYGRHVIVFNPMKPTGKYHFRLYVLCCASTWVAVNYRFHCKSNMNDRLEGVIAVQDAHELDQEMAEAKVSEIRKLVLEVVRPIYGTNRIVSMDNYYTSVQLLQALRLKGLYARGTVRSTSKHFPKHTILEKNTSSRGDYRLGVSAEHGIHAASWCDGSIVQMISNADSSSVSTVTRQVGGSVNSYPAPTCVKEYNKYMQGVDRLDQIRGRFSIADGHSYKKWHKKLALAMIDIARSNAYLTRRQVIDISKERDPHRAFMIQLSSELISGKWLDAPNDDRMAFNSTETYEVNPPPAPPSTLFATLNPDGSPQRRCTAVSSRQVLGDCSRKRRACVVCRWENRYPTEKTDYCGNHNVCLCREIYREDPKTYMCPEEDLTCWEKFHRFYFPNKLFSDKGNIRRTADLYKLKEASSQQNKSSDLPKPRVVRSISSALGNDEHAPIEPSDSQADYSDGDNLDGVVRDDATQAREEVYV